MTATTVADRRSADALAHGTARRLSAFKPTGRLHLGNYLGALRPMVSAQSAVDSAASGGSAGVADSVVMIADLHALTEEHNPAQLRELTAEVLATLLAAGVDPTATLCYVQSDVPEHAELHYLLECATGYGEAARMIQFKERSASRQHVRLSMLTYPVLMAADILLHDADEVPVGDDQTQHVELARDVANRFNTRYGRTFVVPRAVNPPLAARVMDLADPTGKMGKSSASDLGLIYLLDDPDAIRRKVSRAVTDTGTEVAYDPARRPGVANLLEILAACEDAQPADVAARFDSYADSRRRSRRPLWTASGRSGAATTRLWRSAGSSTRYGGAGRNRRASGPPGRSGEPSTPSGSRREVARHRASSSRTSRTPRGVTTWTPSRRISWMAQTLWAVRNHRRSAGDSVGGPGRVSASTMAPLAGPPHMAWAKGVTILAHSSSSGFGGASPMCTWVRTAFRSSQSTMRTPWPGSGSTVWLRWSRMASGLSSRISLSVMARNAGTVWTGRIDVIHRSHRAVVHRAGPSCVVRVGPASCPTPWDCPTEPADPGQR